MINAKTLNLFPAEETAGMLLAGLFRSPHLLLGELTTDGTILRVSRSISTLTGYSDSELTGAKWFELLVSPLGKAEFSSFQERIKKDVSCKFSFPLKTKTGESIPVSWINVHIRNHEGIPAFVYLFGQNHFAGGGIDGNCLTSPELNFREQEKFFATILNDSADGIVILDNSESIQLWNKGAEQIFGYRADEMIGERFSKLLPPHLIETGELDIISEEVHDKGYIRDYETERISKSGRILWINVTRTLIRDSDENILGSSVVLRDITERKMLERQVAHQEKMAGLGLIAAGIAHEVGNPLASISAIVQVFQRKSAIPFIIEQSRIIRNQIERINKILRELVNFAKPPSYAPGSTNINEVIQAALNVIKYDRRTKNIRIDSNLSEEIPLLYIVGDHLLQVIMNIVLNAVDAVEGTDGAIAVSSFIKDEQYACINISDNGMGIPINLREKIFEPFFTTKEVGKGTGLGLSVSYGLVKSMNGRIEVESGEGAGSTFRILLPIAGESAKHA